MVRAGAERSGVRAGSDASPPRSPGHALLGSRRPWVREPRHRRASDVGGVVLRRRLGAAMPSGGRRGRENASVTVLIDTAEARKARGAFYTPPSVAAHLVKWALRTASDDVLEPSCGEAAFLLTAARRMAELQRVDESARGRLDGVELHPGTAERARAVLAGVGARGTVTVGDFFEFSPTRSYDAVVGNPPYVRYQEFSGRSRTLAREAALRAGVNLTALASSWAAFTVHAAHFLRDGGRLALVLPAELLSVNYAAAVRSFLLRSFSRVELVLFDERVFPGVLEEVVLLKADGFATGSCDHFSVSHAKDSEALTELSAGHSWTPGQPGDKWTASMLSAPELAAYGDVLANPAFGDLQTWGETTLGMVTGNNRYFALSPERVSELGLSSDDVIPLSPPGSRHLRYLELNEVDVHNLGRRGAATMLFRPSRSPSAAALRYIAAGAARGVDQAFKCRVRTPWWRVPLVPKPDLFLTYMNADTPRISANTARVHHLNSVHGVHLPKETKDDGARYLPLVALNSVTALGAEIVGRAYGGGMLKIEPREADRLPVPRPELVARVRDRLDDIKPIVGEHLRAGNTSAATEIVDQVVLSETLGIASTDLAAVRSSRVRLAGRRAGRGVVRGERR